MKIHTQICVSLLLIVSVTSCKGPHGKKLQKENRRSGSKEATISQGPGHLVRTIRQDSKGNTWIASWEGVLRYDGKSFTNITSGVSSAHFFSVIEDRKGNFWFSSVGSGVYYYDGKSFRNFTKKDGLAGDRVTGMYEDKKGDIWFSTDAGASRYDGQTFRNFTKRDGLSGNQVNWILEDRSGKFWFCTESGACVYDGNSFLPVTHEGRPFRNVRTIIEDRRGKVWIGGNDGLWSYDGHAFTNLASAFVGYIYEDKKGNIWTSSEFSNSRDWKGPAGETKHQWALSRYDGRVLAKKNPEPEMVFKAMIFGISEAPDGSIWFGSLDGVYRYDGNAITHL